jgi:hypothetical protein
MISPEVKDVIDLVSGLGTLVGFLSFGVGWFITRHDSKEKAARAINQIDTLATNHFPHMQADLTAISKKTDTTNEILTQLRMGQVETNTLLRKV